MTLPAYWLPTLIIISSIAAGIMVSVGGDSLARSVIVLWFLLFCPGMTVVRLLRLEDLRVELVLAFALSLSLCTLTGGAMIYLDKWSPDYGVGALITLTIVGTLLPALGATERLGRMTSRSAGSGLQKAPR